MSDSESYVRGLDVIYGKDANPPRNGDYKKISRDLNKGARGEFVYLCYSNDPSEGDPITDIYIASVGGKKYAKNYRPPKGYDVIMKDLNKGASGRFIYICYTREKGWKPITAVSVIQDGSVDIQPAESGWTRVEQDCSEGAGGQYTYIAYKN